MTVETGARTEIWVKTLDTGPLTRLFGEGMVSYRPAWSPDGKSVLFVSDRDGTRALHQIPADGSAPAKLMLRNPKGRRGVMVARWEVADLSHRVWRAAGHQCARGVGGFRSAAGGERGCGGVQSVAVVGQRAWVFYDPDGKYSYFVKEIPGTPNQMIVVLNWFKESKAKVSE